MAESISNPFRHGTQNHMLLERLRLLPILNHEIVRELGILKYTGRISDVRKKLRIQGFDLVARKIQGEVHEYRIIRPRHEDQGKAQAGGSPS
ncbi:MAG TPA: hypothetical protein PKY58_04850 [Syntrophales bacterium]|nr:hypothetical protein [Syntrophales bacterium]HQN77993.1 hypothetical protein [Syntrophales bacterium]HQQ26835.1 hypothetical protein [Syntrophales bacterium]